MGIRADLWGINIDDTQDILCDLKEEHEKPCIYLKIEADPEIKKQTVAVYTDNGDRLGFLKSALAVDIMELMKEHNINARIVSYPTYDDGDFTGCRIELVNVQKAGTNDRKGKSTTTKTPTGCCMPAVFIFLILSCIISRLLI